MDGPKHQQDTQPATFEPRFYRAWAGRDQDQGQPLKRFNLTQAESDLDLYVTASIEGAAEALAQCRQELIDQIQREPEFLNALEPLAVLTDDTLLIRQMKAAAIRAGVGPMAAVAGAVAGSVGVFLGNSNADVIVENGGDLYLDLSEDRRVLIFAGDSPLSNRLAIHVKAADTPMGICTSSGRFGHSLSFGKADAAVAVSEDSALADAAATAIANRVQTADDLEAAMNFAASIEGLKGALVIVEGQVGLWGELDVRPAKTRDRSP